MTRLTLDPTEVYSDCGSSSSSFAYGIPTPTSSTAFSTATSRRHSTASEIQAGNESAYDRVSTFSTAGITTPIETPPPFRSTFHFDSFSCTTQGYEAEFSPIGFQDRGRLDTSLTANGVLFQDPFSPKSPCAYARAIPGLDGGTHEGYHGDYNGPIESRQMGKTSMDWPTSFNHGPDGGYNQTESARFSEPFVLDASGFTHLGLLNSPPYVGSSMIDGMAAVTNSPQTISPQETFVCPNTSFVPTTPTYQALEDPFHTPVIKSEAREYESLVHEWSSPCSSSSDDLNFKREESNIQPRRRNVKLSIRQSSKPERRSTKRTRRSFDLLAAGSASPAAREYPLIVNSQIKPHECEVCVLNFDRPEHRRRHFQSMAHNKRCREQGRTPTRDYEDEKPFKCVVPSCGVSVTRKDNLKPHYQKTHLYVKETNGKKKRNDYVSVEEARKLGIDGYDLRTESGQEDTKLCRNAKRELSSDSDGWYDG
ncbi:MAG: hypothetical protein L6R35_002559 [Caloplaca aegaea]|nr:MAG: hypothetical protein L6R35_002559 [Caloplaca aegaea]